jgi:hypothetical protein
MGILDRQVKKRALESLTRTLKTAGCPKEAATLIRNAFWQTLTHTNKPAPTVYEQPTLFEI